MRIVPRISHARKVPASARVLDCFAVRTHSVKSKTITLGVDAALDLAKDATEIVFLVSFTDLKSTRERTNNN